MKNRNRIIGAGVAATLAAAVLGVVTQGPKFYELPRTQDIKYQAVPKSWLRWGTPRDVAGLTERLRVLLEPHKGASFVIKPKGADTWSRARNLKRTLEVLVERLQDAEVDQVWYARAVLDGYTAKARKVDLNPAVAMDTEGTVPIDIVAGTVFSRFDGIENWGIYNCRTIAGSSTLSQHAYANAIDFGGDTAVLDRVANYLYDLTKKGYVPASQLLWEGENMLSGNAVSDHYNHIHVSGDPLLSGPCRTAD